MFDDAADALEEIEPEDKTRKEVLGARIELYMAAKKWDMAAAVASHLANVEPEEAGWWISLAYSTRRCHSIEEAEKILLQASELHHDNALIEFNLACYASVTGRFEEARFGLRRAIEIDMTRISRGLVALGRRVRLACLRRFALWTIQSLPSTSKAGKGRTHHILEI